MIFYSPAEFLIIERRKGKRAVSEEVSVEINPQDELLKNSRGGRDI